MQEKAWEKEYRNSQLLVKENIPSKDVVHFAQFLKKIEKIDFDNMKILDLGSGMGRNAHYFALFGAQVIGLEISETAIALARKNAERSSLAIEYKKRSIGEKFLFNDDEFDIVLDVLSSNSLDKKERDIYLSETKRILKSNGYFFVKALCKDGDANAKTLLKQFAGTEIDTYIMPELNVIERVWSREDITKTYSEYFSILHLEKITRYTKMNNRSYKRNFWICYMQK